MQVGKKQIEEMEEKEAIAVVKATSDLLIGREMMKDQDFTSAKQYLTDALAAALKTRSKDLQEEIRSQIKCALLLLSPCPPRPFARLLRRRRRQRSCETLPGFVSVNFKSSSQRAQRQCSLRALTASCLLPLSQQPLATRGRILRYTGTGTGTGTSVPVLLRLYSCS
eukprot:SAG25_NODE_1547_length_2790_cov_1.502044_5_plen_167_part_00